MMIGDAHIYEDHWEATREQTRRKPFDMPSYGYMAQKDLYSFTPDDFIVKNYEHHSAIDYLLKE